MQRFSPCETQPASFVMTLTSSFARSAASSSRSTEPSVEPPSATRTSTSPEKSWAARSARNDPTCSASFSIGVMTEIRVTALESSASPGTRCADGDAMLPS
jgi:hypothetical protein